jgi:hypothetical protein
LGSHFKNEFNAELCLPWQPKDKNSYNLSKPKELELRYLNFYIETSSSGCLPRLLKKPWDQNWR